MKKDSQFMSEKKSWVVNYWIILIEFLIIYCSLFFCFSSKKWVLYFGLNKQYFDQCTSERLLKVQQQILDILQRVSSLGVQFARKSLAWYDK